MVEYLGWKYRVSKEVPSPTIIKTPSVTISPTIEPTVTVKPTVAPITYKIIYNLNGGTNHKKNPASYTNKDIILKSPQKKGCTFEGWYLDKNYKQKITKIVTKERTIM